MKKQKAVGVKKDKLNRNDLNLPAGEAFNFVALAHIGESEVVVPPLTSKVDTSNYCVGMVGIVDDYQADLHNDTTTESKAVHLKRLRKEWSGKEQAAYHAKHQLKLF